MTIKAILFVALALATTGSALSCPDLSLLRSKNILNGFNPALLDGMWYENAYMDIAQIGARCQTINSTFNSTSGEIKMGFKVKYIDHKIPFTLDEDYHPNPDKSQVGLYTKVAFESEMLKLPTVFVDATLSEDGTRYETMSIYTCLSLPAG
jgi:hypothetical protein